MRNYTYDAPLSTRSTHVVLYSANVPALQEEVARAVVVAEVMEEEVSQ